MNQAPSQSQAVEPKPQFDIRASVLEVLDHFQALLTGEGQPPGLSTGFRDLDELTNGLKPGEVFVLASRPNMGRTALMLNLVEHICVDQNVPTLLFSGHLSAFEIVQRLVFARANFSVPRIYKKHLPTKADFQRIQRAASELARAPLLVDDTYGLSIQALGETARRHQRGNALGFIAIDELQLLRSDSKWAIESREREIIEISSALKKLARELCLPILVLASLNRGPEHRRKPRPGFPRPTDLMDSDAILHAADLFSLLYRPQFYAEDMEEREAEAGKAELILAKNQNGLTGVVPLSFCAELMRFKSRSTQDE